MIYTITKPIEYRMELEIDGQRAYIVDIIHGKRAAHCQIAPGFMQVNTKNGAHTLPDRIVTKIGTTHIKTSGHRYTIKITRND